MSVVTKQVEFPVAGVAEFGSTKTVRLPVDVHHLLSRVVCAFELPALVPNRVFSDPPRVWVNTSRQVSADGALFYSVDWPLAQLLRELDQAEATPFAVDAEGQGTFDDNAAGQVPGGTFDAGTLPPGDYAVEYVSEATVVARALGAAAQALAVVQGGGLTLPADAPDVVHTYSASRALLGRPVQVGDALAPTTNVVLSPKQETHPLHGQGYGHFLDLGTERPVLFRGRTYVFELNVAAAEKGMRVTAGELELAGGTDRLTVVVPADATELAWSSPSHPGMGGVLPVGSDELLSADGYALDQPWLARGVLYRRVEAPADFAVGAQPEGGVPVKTFANPQVLVAPPATPADQPYAGVLDDEHRLTLDMLPPGSDELQAAGLPVQRYAFLNPAGEQIRYVDGVSSLLIDRVRLLVDKKPIDEQSGVFSVLYGDLTKESASVEQVFLDRQDRSLTTYRDVVPATTVFTPLKLFFCHGLATALPIFKLRGCPVELEFTFRPFEAMYMTRRNLFQGMVRNPVDVPGTPIPPVRQFGASLLVDYVDVEDTSALRDADRFLITSYALTEAKGVTEADVQVSLKGLTQPVQRLLWYAQTESNLQSNDALNFTTREAYAQESAKTFYRSTASHDPQQQILTPADFVVLDPAVATGPNTAQALAHISAAVQANTVALFNMYHDFMQTQVVVDQAITQLYEIENNLLNYVDEHVAYVWRKSAEVDARLQDVERNVDHFPHQYDADGEHLLAGASVHDAQGEIVRDYSWRYFHYVDGYRNNNYLRYNVYSLWFSQRRLGEGVVDTDSVIADSWPGRRGGGAALQDNGLTLKLRLNPDCVSPDRPVRVRVYAITYSVMQIKDGKPHLCAFEKAQQVWNCAVPEPAAESKPQLEAPAAAVDRGRRRRPLPSSQDDDGGDDDNENARAARSAMQAAKQAQYAAHAAAERAANAASLAVSVGSAVAASESRQNAQQNARQNAPQAPPQAPPQGLPQGLPQGPPLEPLQNARQDALLQDAQNAERAAAAGRRIDSLDPPEDVRATTEWQSYLSRKVKEPEDRLEPFREPRHDFIAHPQVSARGDDLAAGPLFDDGAARPAPRSVALTPELVEHDSSSKTLGRRPEEETAWVLRPPSFDAPKLSPQDHERVLPARPILGGADVAERQAGDWVLQHPKKRTLPAQLAPPSLPQAEARPPRARPQSAAPPLPEASAVHLLSRTQSLKQMLRSAQKVASPHALVPALQLSHPAMGSDTGGGGSVRN